MRLFFDFLQSNIFDSYLFFIKENPDIDFCLFFRFFRIPELVVVLGFHFVIYRFLIFDFLNMRFNAFLVHHF